MRKLKVRHPIEAGPSRLCPYNTLNMLKELYPLLKLPNWVFWKFNLITHLLAVDQR
jgi:hypothetical protein